MRFATIATLALLACVVASARGAGVPPPAASAAPAPAGAPAGMQRYTLGILYRGPAWTPERSARVDSLQRGHLANILAMFERGALVGAGPFLDDAHVIGLFIFRCDSSAAAALVRNDPAIGSQRFAIALLPWWAPAGIGDAYRASYHGESPENARMERLEFAFLLRGPAWSPVETPATAALQRAHLEHLKALGASGALIAAGPFDGDSDLRGVLVFRADSATARRLAADDPKVKSGWLTLDFHPWMVAAGVMPASKAR